MLYMCTLKWNGWTWNSTYTKYFSFSPFYMNTFRQLLFILRQCILDIILHSFEFFCSSCRRDSNALTFCLPQSWYRTNAMHFHVNCECMQYKQAHYVHNYQDTLHLRLLQYLFVVYNFHDALYCHIWWEFFFLQNFWIYVSFTSKSQTINENQAATGNFPKSRTKCITNSKNE